MGSNLSKRLASIRDQVEAQDGYRLGFTRTFILCFILTAMMVSVWSGVFSSPRPKTNSHSPIELQDPEQLVSSKATTDDWLALQEFRARERIVWLRDSWWASGATTFYRNFAKNILSSFEEDALRSREVGEMDIFAGLSIWASQVTAGILLRGVFLFFVSWPIWLLGTLGGIIYFRFLMIPKPTQDLLGICSRNRGPFYSGIYGPLKPNASYSATDFSCPGLACPKMVPIKSASSHGLMNLLRSFGALNDVNTDLVRIILAYRDLPSFVEEERVIEDDSDANTPTGVVPLSPPAPTISALRTNADGTIEQSALEGLRAVLSAHRLLGKYFKPTEDREAESKNDEQLLGTHREQLIKGADKFNLEQLAKILATSLTPVRARALAALPTEVVATAYLATEAGKVLVYKPEGKAYVQFSRFPHLQARAVVQSLLSFHQDYDGDSRMIVRQALVSARRHGDFGRAFLPTSMSQASRALRDWLEIMYAAREKRGDVANMVELDAHIEEIGHNWKNQLVQKLELSLHQDRHKQSSDDPKAFLWKGLPFKSVVLLPLSDIVNSALSGLSAQRVTRVTELFQLTRKLSAAVSISARLPGFKRQAEEAEKGGLESGGLTQQLAEREENRGLVERWLIVRRMLTRYNWLSTRIGDDAVPVDGLVQGLLLNQRVDNSIQVVELGALVPLRQRRFRELLGARWEQTFYTNAPHSSCIETFVDAAEFQETFTARKEQAAKGLLDPKLLQAGGGPAAA